MADGPRSMLPLWAISSGLPNTVPGVVTTWFQQNGSVTLTEFVDGYGIQMRLI